MDWEDFIDLIVEHLSDDLLSKSYRELKKNRKVSRTFGHCYVASEAAYYMLGGKAEGWTPYYVKHRGYSHWFLKHKSGAILDITKGQFKDPIDYSKAQGKGFLTNKPSKRAKKLINKIGNVVDYFKN